MQILAAHRSAGPAVFMGSPPTRNTLLWIQVCVVGDQVDLQQEQHFRVVEAFWRQHRLVE